MPAPDYEPQVAVLIPAYNEEKVIVRTIRSVMMSNYKNLRIIVIDDGSTDRTFDVAREAYPSGYCVGPADGADQAERRQGGCAELCAGSDR